MAYLLTLLVLAAIGAAAFAQGAAGAYRFSAWLDDADKKFKLSWKVDGESITFEAVVKTTGWIGFGVSPTGMMTGSDMVIGWVDGAKTVFHDRYATGYTMPVIDTKQSWTLVGGKEDGGFTNLTFTRPLNTNDCDQDVTITSDTLRLLWAYGDADPPNENSISKHTVRGTKIMSLLEPAQDKSSTIPATAKQLRLLNPNVSVPNDTTTYWCQSFKMPAFDRKQHIIKFGALIQKENRDYVHHIVAYACYDKLNDSFNNLGYTCYTPEMPQELMCRHSIAIWAIGGEDFYFPDNVGFSIGASGDPTYIIIETHFDNPQKRSDIKDNSGLVFTYIDTLRPMEAGVLEIGQSVSPVHVIPPKTKQFVTIGVCLGNCTSQAVPEQGISAFAYMLHTHRLGQKIRIRQFRNEKEIGNLGRDDKYDFNYQLTKTFPNEKKIERGDTLVLECFYDSTDRNAVTFGGLSTKEEMCLAWLYYYPKSEFSYCASEIHPKNLIRAFKNVDPKTVYTGAPENNKTSWYEVISQAKWDDESVKAMQGIQTLADLVGTCETRTRVEYPGHNKEHKFPLFVQPMAASSDPCIKETSWVRPAALPTFLSEQSTTAKPKSAGVSLVPFRFGGVCVWLVLTLSST